MTIKLPLPEWKIESIKRNFDFYLDALTHNELTVVDGNEFTSRRSQCEICMETQAPGVRKFLYRDRIQPIHFWFIHPCQQCWNDLSEAAFGLYLYERAQVHNPIVNPNSQIV